MLQSNNSQGINTYYVKNNILHNTYTPNFHCEKINSCIFHIFQKYAGITIQMTKICHQSLIRQQLIHKSKGKDTVPSDPKISEMCFTSHLQCDIKLMYTDNDFGRKLLAVHHLTDTFICIPLNEIH